MNKSKFTDSQKSGVLKQAAAGTSVPVVLEHDEVAE